MLPEREYFWNVFNSRYKSEVKRLIDWCNQKRADGLEEEEGEKVAIREDILDAIQNSHYRASKL